MPHHHQHLCDFYRRTQHIQTDGSCHVSVWNNSALSVDGNDHRILECSRIERRDIQWLNWICIVRLVDNGGVPYASTYSNTSSETRRRDNNCNSIDARFHFVVSFFLFIPISFLLFFLVFSPDSNPPARFLADFARRELEFFRSEIE